MCHEETKGYEQNLLPMSVPKKPATYKATAAKTACIGPRVGGGRLRHDRGPCLIEERWKMGLYGEWRMIEVRQWTMYETLYDSFIMILVAGGKSSFVSYSHRLNPILRKNKAK